MPSLCKSVVRICQNLLWFWIYLHQELNFPKNIKTIKPGGLGTMVRQSCAAADLTLAVVTPDPVSVRDCAQLSRVLLQNGVESQKIIINQVPKKLKGAIGDLDEVLDGTGIMLQGVGPFSEELQAAALAGRPLLPGKEQTAFSNIAARLCGQTRPLAFR